MAYQVVLYKRAKLRLTLGGKICLYLTTVFFICYAIKLTVRKQKQMQLTCPEVYVKAIG